MHTSQNSEGSFQTDEFERVQVFFLDIDTKFGISSS